MSDKIKKIINPILKNIFPAACAVLLLIILTGIARTGQTEIAENSEETIAEIEDMECDDLEEITEEIIEEEPEEPSIEELMVPFDIENPYIYCKSPKCIVSDDRDEISFSCEFSDGIPESDDDNIYLFEFSTYESEEEIEDKKPVADVEKREGVSIQIPYKDRLLFSRFALAIKYDDQFVLLSEGKYISNPEVLADNTDDYMEIESKKGILLDANTIDKDELYDLNVKRAVYNIPLSFIIGETLNEAVPTIDYEYNGTTYHFNGLLCGGFDSLISYLTTNGIHTTIIILNDWNEDYLEIIHPKARKKTGRSQYYAFNTEEEDGVRLMEATAMFLADRYDGGEYGLVSDWVIANEINQQKIWNYMDTSDVDYYTESFEKSFRTFYNAIRSRYSNAKVYFSIDHDWNDNYGSNRRFFNGRDVLYKFNEYAIKGGNYDWCLSIHPYPNPLTRVKFWQGSFDKTEEAGLLTPMNLSTVTDVMTKDEFLNTKGEVRDIGITELGFTSGSGEELQAAAFAYCYYIVENNEYISSFLMNRQTDDAGALQSGLKLGIYNYDYSAKCIKEVFSNIDSEEGKDYIPRMLELIGAKSLNEALSWAE